MYRSDGRKQRQAATLLSEASGTALKVHAEIQEILLKAGTKQALGNRLPSEAVETPPPNLTGLLQLTLFGGMRLGCSTRDVHRRLPTSNTTPF